jgi:DsbC/DsbD-like thiol-disulfide interchange protein
LFLKTRTLFPRRNGDRTGNRTKTIKITGIPDIPELVLRGKTKINLEIWNASVLLGKLDLGTISYWRKPGEAGKGKELYWENFVGWVEASHVNRKPKAQ